MYEHLLLEVDEHFQLEKIGLVVAPDFSAPKTGKWNDIDSLAKVVFPSGDQEVHKVHVGIAHFNIRDPKVSIDKRSIYAGVFEFQNRFDCSYTHFRVMQNLIESRYVYTHASTSPNGWCGDAYVKNGVGYFDAGSKTWENAVKAGELKGADANRPLKVNLYGLVKEYSSHDPDLWQLWEPLMSELK